MKLTEAIQIVDSLKPNGFDFDTKMRWLSELDGKVKTEVINTHRGGEKIKFSGYTDASMSQHYVLLIPYPYDDVYLKWLEAKIDYHNGEIARYNNSIALYNTAMTAFINYYNRNNMPLNRARFNYFGTAKIDKPINEENNSPNDYYNSHSSDDNGYMDLPPYSEDIDIDDTGDENFIGGD